MHRPHKSLGTHLIAFVVVTHCFLYLVVLYRKYTLAGYPTIQGKSFALGSVKVCQDVVSFPPPFNQ